MQITMLGTGHAMVTECYNTCFVLEESNHYFLVDGGGGSAILRQLKHAGINGKDIKHIFVTHKHIDHLTGIIWMIRTICQSMNQGENEGEVLIYAHAELTEMIYEISNMLLQKKETRLLGERVHLIPVSDGDEVEILGRRTTFFDIQSTKAKQYGFCMYLENDEKLTCCGDEPYKECERKYVQGSKWLMHEAFCLYREADLFRPYEKQHSTVREACQTAERLGVKNLLLYHTEDHHIKERKKLYHAEGSQYFHGRLYIPDDLERLVL